MVQVLLGCEKMKVDTKGRVAIPTRFLQVLRAKNKGSEPFGMIISPERSIRLMPYPLYLDELEYWGKLDDRRTADRMIKNMVLSTAEDVLLDAQNRIKLNADTMELCRIAPGQHVSIVGTMHYLQVFDVNVRKEMFEKDLSALGAAMEAVEAKNDPKPHPQPYRQVVLNLADIDAMQENPPERH